MPAPPTAPGSQPLRDRPCRRRGHCLRVEDFSSTYHANHAFTALSFDGLPRPAPSHPDDALE